ncbi:phosphate/phosphite/phosphonate ABC transporter substrate-binding protein [Shewanella eurypsychrophilus]|uniref:Phosphate/phosphite/phosphonate ABC transporter substrate-binding protein n=1 Tax=Shewanella eurypsychrophilus TaxID=2593656 RepID=A0ABX6V9U6_9GAMM|nr:MULTISPECIES: phosphate/phosphite/phosphonate ABC transporter substrate-binding protein [Shewanella]QFU23407.1 PhnD/SsuA/transferrin family substrate-binding protein [Shewanella sp. YLB-09]QPG58636.1 phosphate/phosphite/phosphonate ABC transporter substrate-binding protein [Shewanella eurypsychrophilus]
MKISPWLLFSLWLVLISFSQGVSSNQTTEIKEGMIEPVVLSFGVVPQQAASTLARKWSPLLAALSQNANFQLRFATAPDIPTFEKRLTNGEYDIAYMNPYHFTVFNETPGYQALVREKNKKLQGIIVVRKDSHIDSLEQLQGATMAFPAPAAFAASVLPRANLRIKGLTNQIKYVGSHDSVYLAVVQGLVTAGGGVKRTFKTMDSKVTSQLKVLWETPGYTPHAIATNPRVEASIISELVDKFSHLSSTEDGLALLDSLGFKPFEVAENSDWDDVRALGLGNFAKPLETINE